MLFLLLLLLLLMVMEQGQLIKTVWQPKVGAKVESVQIEGLVRIGSRMRWYDASMASSLRGGSSYLGDIAINRRRHVADGAYRAFQVR